MPTPATRYRVMAMRDGRPVVIAQPLTARQAMLFAAGSNHRGWYVELMPDDVRPAALAK